MVLLDEKGDRIHASVDKDCVGEFKNKLVEGRSVVLDTFKVGPYQSAIRTSRCSFKIRFYATTGVSPCSDFPGHVPEKYMLNFQDILSGNLDRSYLIDVMGQIVRMGNVEEVTAQRKALRDLDLI
ncbi:unnamed protein product [Microthlaspi erraticum]|uniref:Replication protein A 70 kDa DNA-binding subunit B/D first OB fold domain-containing protein n=1 Tax=Microthlaspi erraticum TaxID=1685480 RepID=A0A6D2JUT5_9BRAS|nr:unnamed protein product [Microthlaspi erraticum]